MWDFSDSSSEDMNFKEKEEKHVLSVSEAIIVIKENITRIPLLTVVGEVSGFRGPNARSGHCYFDIKDASASMAAIVWKGIYLASGVALHDGMRVQITGRYDVYKGSGKLSFVATSLTVAGEGDLRQKVAELAKKLEREGLMREDRKRPIPRFCTRIGVVTSLSGSVIEDVKRTLARRNPLVEIEVTGAAVQGKHAPQTIVQALGIAESTHPDAILLVRGGGSFEDLMCFNDEAVARAIAASSVPIITGIGHEPDVTIADMVSDRRTSTPTAAAESVAPSISELQMAFNDRVSRLAGATEALLLGHAQEIDGFSRRADLAIQNSLRQRQIRFLALAERNCLSDPLYLFVSRKSDLLQTEQRLHDALPLALNRKEQALTQSADRLKTAATRLLAPYEAQVSAAAGKLEALSPLKVLGRGYALATDAQGHVLKNAHDAQKGEAIRVKLAEGSLVAHVTEIEA